MTSADGWRGELAATGELTPEITARILTRYGERGRKAIDAIGEQRVKQYRDFTVVVGHTEEYVVEGGSCPCKDAEYNLDAEDPDDLCWHALAVEIAKRVDALDEHDMWYSEVNEFI